jgi:hypothetical protein
LRARALRAYLVQIAQTEEKISKNFVQNDEKNLPKTY